MVLVIFAAISSRTVQGTAPPRSPSYSLQAPGAFMLIHFDVCQSLPFVLPIVRLCLPSDWNGERRLGPLGVGMTVVVLPSLPVRPWGDQLSRFSFIFVQSRWCSRRTYCYGHQSHEGINGDSFFSRRIDHSVIYLTLVAFPIPLVAFDSMLSPSLCSLNFFTK